MSYNPQDSRTYCSFWIYRSNCVVSIGRHYFAAKNSCLAIDLKCVNCRGSILRANPKSSSFSSNYKLQFICNSSAQCRRVMMLTVHVFVWVCAITSSYRSDVVFITWPRTCRNSGVYVCLYCCVVYLCACVSGFTQAGKSSQFFLFFCCALFFVQVQLSSFKSPARHPPTNGSFNFYLKPLHLRSTSKWLRF